MKTKTVIKYTRNLTPEEFSQCYKKNFGGGGHMRDDLVYAYHQKDPYSKVVLIKGPQGGIRAWALTQQEAPDRASVMFWVVREYRRQGYGARLFRHVQKIDAQPLVFPHDDASGRFFKKFEEKIRVERWDRYWLDA